MPQNYTGRVVTIVIVLLAALWAIFPNPANLFRSDLSLGEKVNLKPGIDMQGGTSLLYEIKPPEGEDGAAAPAAYRGGLAEEVMTALKRRVDPNGTRNLIWRPHGDTRLEIQMPATAESQQAEQFGRALNEARDALERTNVSPAEVVAAVERSPDPAARDKRLAELAGGSKARQEAFAQLVAAWDKLQQARKDQNAEAAADAQEAYAKAQAQINATNLRPGDLFGSGTISGTEPNTQGSILEQTQGGKVAMQLAGGEERKFLQDGDTLVIRGWAGKEGALVGFGEVSGKILPAHPLF